MQASSQESVLSLAHRGRSRRISKLDIECLHGRVLTTTSRFFRYIDWLDLQVLVATAVELVLVVLNHCLRLMSSLKTELVRVHVDLIDLVEMRHRCLRSWGPLCRGWWVSVVIETGGWIRSLIRLALGSCIVLKSCLLCTILVVIVTWSDIEFHTFDRACCSPSVFVLSVLTSGYEGSIDGHFMGLQGHGYLLRWLAVWTCLTTNESLLLNLLQVLIRSLDHRAVMPLLLMFR